MRRLRQAVRKRRLRHEAGDADCSAAAIHERARLLVDHVKMEQHGNPQQQRRQHLGRAPEPVVDVEHGDAFVPQQSPGPEQDLGISHPLVGLLGRAPGQATNATCRQFRHDRPLTREQYQRFNAGEVQLA